MTSSASHNTPAALRSLVLHFNDANQLLLCETSAGWAPAPCEGVEVKRVFTTEAGGEVRFGRLSEEQAESLLLDGARAWSIAELREEAGRFPERFLPDLHQALARIQPHLIRIPYLYKGENDYIYRFRTEKQRNRGVYDLDSQSARLYQSALCQAIKAAKRVNERSSSTPAVLDFGAVSYVLPSHFGFCLGVQNAIERAYESISENPGKRVFMLSELIHNPFVNEDLQARGLRYLQSDKGKPSIDPGSGRAWWDLLTKEDVVIIPAFGATDEDKVRLIEKGIAINRYDATCMLVEKVWKAAQRFGRDGFTVIIHGKAEHEETKATFSNAAKAGHALIVRNTAEAETVGNAILAEDAQRKRELLANFADRCTPGFDPAAHLERVAVVNQTTLLRNETLSIIEYLEKVFAQKYGADRVGEHLNSNSKGDTLCYATQVNQDALEKALALPLDAAVVAGGTNSSNTFQLFRMCEQRLGMRAFYIQSERNLLSRDRVRHYSFPASGKGGDLVERDFLPAGENFLRLLLTGGASCPDGIIQQIISRINSFFPVSALRSVDEVLAEVTAED